VWTNQAYYKIDDVVGTSERSYAHKEVNSAGSLRKLHSDCTIRDFTRSSGCLTLALMEPFSPIVFSWEQPCTQAFVTGDFNDFALAELTGADKSAIIWLQPGIYYYKFVVDEVSLTSQALPTRTMYGMLFHRLEVKCPPQPIKYQSYMSAVELERIDEEVFQLETESNLYEADEETVSDLQSTPIREVSSKFFKHQLKAYIPVKSAAVKIQALARMFLCRKRYLKYKEQVLGHSPVKPAKKVELSRNSVFARLIAANVLLTQSVRRSLTHKNTLPKRAPLPTRLP
jgi:hypothetical protein